MPTSAKLHALAARFPNISQARWFNLTCWQQVDTAAARLPQEAVQATWERGRGRDLFATAEELLQELSHPG